MTQTAHTVEKPPHVEVKDVVRYAVQNFDLRARKWLNINDRIFVRDYMKPGTTHETAVAKARAEADRQVSGWWAGYPLRSYRAIAIDY